MLNLNGLSGNTVSSVSQMTKYLATVVHKCSLFPLLQCLHSKINIQQAIRTSHRNQPVHWEHTINIQAVATGTTKGEELKRIEGEAFETKATAAECTERHLVQKASRQRRGQEEPSQPQTTAGARLVPRAEAATLPGAPMCLLYKIRLNQATKAI